MLHQSINKFLPLVPLWLVRAGHRVQAPRPPRARASRRPAAARPPRRRTEPVGLPPAGRGHGTGTGAPPWCRRAGGAAGVAGVLAPDLVR